MSKATLFDLAGELHRIYELIEANEGDMSDGLDEMLTISKNELDDKTDRYKGMIDTLESDIENIKNSISLLELKAKRNAKVIAKLKQTIIDATKLYGTRKFIPKTGNVTYSFAGDATKANVSRSLSMVLKDTEKVPAFLKETTYTIPPLDVHDKEWLVNAVQAYSDATKTAILLPIDEVVKPDTKQIKAAMVQLRAEIDRKEERRKSEPEDVEREEQEQRELGNKLPEELLEEMEAYAQLTESWNVKFTV